jgi:hypothetical protein
MMAACICVSCGDGYILGAVSNSSVTAKTNADGKIACPRRGSIAGSKACLARVQNAGRRRPAITMTRRKITQNQSVRWSLLRLLRPEKYRPLPQPSTASSSVKNLVIQDEYELSRSSHCGVFLSTVGWMADGCVCSRWPCKECESEQAFPHTLPFFVSSFTFQTYQVLTTVECLGNRRRTNSSSSSSRSRWVRMPLDSSFQSHRRPSRTPRTARRRRLHRTTLAFSRSFIILPIITLILIMKMPVIFRASKAMTSSNTVSTRLYRL